jgi:CMP-N-acetylneuraminic acid synthetase
MFNIGQFFKRIQNKHTQELFVRSLIQESIQQSVGVKIPLEDITLSSGVITLHNISSGLKSVVFVKKQKILESINATQSIQAVHAIR